MGTHGNRGVISRNYSNRWHGRLCALALLLAAAPFAHAADPQLVINELMVHPLEFWPPTQPYPNTNLSEYVELYNAGTTTISLANYRFDTGITFTFTNGTLAPGAYGILCENRSYFTNAYLTVTNVLGQFAGKLNDGGERITLSRLDGVTSNWVTEDTISYIEDTETDGTGKSLELIHPKFARLDDQFSWDWVASTTVSGTPGVVNSRFTAAPFPVGGDIQQDLALPPSQSSVKITTRASGRDGVTTNVLALLLEYRRDAPVQSDYTNTPMRDDGIEGDAAPNDGVYTAFLPPFGSPIVTTNGDLLEFRIRLSDSLGTRTIPATNRTAIPGTNFSCFVKFGEDPQTSSAFPGEYETWHMLMSRSAKTTFESRTICSETNAEITVVTPAGDVIYNCGLRLRGSSSRVATLGNYRIEFPPSTTFASSGEANLNQEDAICQFIGMTLHDRAGEIASDVHLARVWFNESLKNPPTQGIYCRVQGLDNDYLADHVPDGQDGNTYMATGTDGCRPSFLGDLSYFPSIASYSPLYETKINNPHTAWYDLQAMTYDLNQPTTTYTTNLTNRVDIVNWGRTFAINICLDNGEAGYFVPGSVPAGDELRLYCNPVSGQSLFFPWDYSDVVGLTTPTIRDMWGFNNAVIKKFLYNQPIVAYYTGNLLDVITNTMSDANMNALFDEIGSKMTPTQRSTALTHTQSRRANILSNLNLNLTVNGLPANAPALLVPSATTGSVQVTLGGTAPQSYTARVLVNGIPTSWNLTNNVWTMTNAATFPGDVADMVIHAVNPKNAVIKELSFKAIGLRSALLAPTTISTTTSWTYATGTYVVSNDVTVSAGGKLTIAPQTTVLFAPGRKLTVNGTLEVLGSPATPVNLYPYGDTNAWSIEASGATASLIISNAVISSGRIVVTNAARLAIYHSTISGSQDTNGIIRAIGAGAVYMTSSIVSNFNRTRFDTSPTFIDQCLLTHMSAVGIEFTGAATTSTVRRTNLRNPVGTDGIVFTSATAGLVTNVAIGYLSGTGLVINASTVHVVDTLLDTCGTGIRVTGASSATIRNNTIVDCGTGIHGAPAITNTIVWSGILGITNGPAAVAFSDVQFPDNDAHPGTGNINRNPFFRDKDNQDYQLKAISPCLATGAGGANMGVPYPTGANPIAPTNLFPIATSNTIFLAWTDLSPDETGFEIFRSNGGTTFTRIATTAANVTNYTDTGLGQDNSYYYRLRAVHARGESTYTDVASIRTTFQDMTQLLIQYLRITEIMYDPPGTSDFEEFLEFKNISSNAFLNLSGLYLDGVTFTFTHGTTLAPQQFFVLARNADAFAAAHPAVTINGTNAASALNNAGEELIVFDAANTEIIRFDYGNGDNGNSWYPTTRNVGYSLVPNEPNPYTGDPDDDVFWRASTLVGGSPGADDQPSPYDGIVINEVLPHADDPLEDAIELRNIGTNTVNVAGWFVSDNGNALKRYQITSGPSTTIPPGGFHVLYAGPTFNKPSLGTNAFEFSELGTESVFLSAATNGSLTGYRSTFTFTGAIENGYSHGRYIRSNGSINFTAMSSRSFGNDNPVTLGQFRNGTGLPNPAPRVGPVVINEITYNPGPGGLEYVELVNITAAAVRLFTNSSPNLASNTWRFANAFNYLFPTNTILAAGEHILVSGTDPAEFRATLGIDPAIRIFGPFDGNLSNGGETIELYKPEVREANGDFPQVIADRVQYDDDPPWPAAADNDGASLERISPTAYGNDFTNWVGITIGGTPGRTNNTGITSSVGFADVSTARVETNEVVEIDVVLQPALASTVTVYYAVTGGSATQGNDYTLSAGSVIFWPNETQKAIPLTILNDASGEQEETLEITFTNITGNAILGGNILYIHTIIDNDSTNLPPPIILPSTTTDFTNSVLVTVSLPAVPGAMAYYTLDGTIPDRDDELYIGPFTLNASALVVARTFQGEQNSGAWTSTLFRAQSIPTGWVTPDPLPPSTVEVLVRASTDDGWQNNGTGLLTVNSTTIALATNSNFGALFRFYEVGIPQGVTITNAWVQFTAASNTPVSAFVTIRGEATNNSPTLPSSGNNNIRNRLVTTNRVFWTPPAWNTSERGTAQRTPNLATIITEIVGRPGWTSNNALSVIFTNSPSGVRVVHAIDGLPSQAALFHAEWTPPPQTQYYFAALTNGIGSITGGNLYVPIGSNATAIADADYGYAFSGWTGNTGAGNTNTPSLTVLMDQNRTVTANFLLLPPPPYPPLRTISSITPTTFTITWLGSPSYHYNVYRTTNLVLDFLGETLTNDMPGHPSGTNTYTDTTATNQTSFYTIGADFPP